METNEKIAPDLRLHEKDVGSASVQIARLTARILHIGNHLKTHSKDNHSRRGLIAMVSLRRKLWLTSSAKHRKSTLKRCPL